LSCPIQSIVHYICSICECELYEFLSLNFLLYYAVKDLHW